MRANSFRKLLIDAVRNWSGDVKDIEEQDSKIIAKMHDGSELEITVKQLQKATIKDCGNTY
jgi:ribosome maturation factor RimP